MLGSPRPRPPIRDRSQDSATSDLDSEREASSEATPATTSAAYVKSFVSLPLMRWPSEIAMVYPGRVSAAVLIDPVVELMILSPDPTLPHPGVTLQACSRGMYLGLVLKWQTKATVFSRKFSNTWRNLKIKKL